MTFTARLLIALSGAEILFICCGRILRASSSQSSAQKMIQIIALTVTSSRTDGLKWFYRPMKTMSLSLHFLLSFTNVWLVTCSSCWGLRAQGRVLFIYSQVVTSSSFHHRQVKKIVAFYEDLFSPLFGENGATEDVTNWAGLGVVEKWRQGHLSPWRKLKYLL